MVSSADRCERCGERLVWARTGRPARYCSTRCRVAAHRARPRQLVIDQAADVPPEPEPALVVDPLSRLVAELRAGGWPETSTPDHT